MVKTVGNTILADWVFSLNIIRNLELKGLELHNAEAEEDRQMQKALDNLNKQKNNLYEGERRNEILQDVSKYANAIKFKHDEEAANSGRIDNYNSKEDTDLIYNDRNKKK